MKAAPLLLEAYDRLLAAFGRQHWWPGETPFEIIVGAILTQNTNWKNVEKAILNLRRNDLLTAEKLSKTHPTTLARLIRPSGYYSVKARRLRNFLSFFLSEYQGRIASMRKDETTKLREKLLAVNGIGPETADSILLYALEKSRFVVDAYTKRIFNRHYLIPEETTYDDLQQLFMDNLPQKVPLFNEYHALIVKCGKQYCRNRKPLCQNCPLNGLNW